MATDTTFPNVLDDSATINLATASQVAGNVLANDSDPDGDTLTVATVNAQAGNVGASLGGQYGTLLLNANGSYSYVVNSSAVQGLTAGQTVTDTFGYTVSDGNNHSVTTTTITNQNLITWSEAFDNASWVKFGSTLPTVTANVAAGPSGGAATADQLTLTKADSGIYFQTGLTGQYTFSVWVRLVSGDGHFDLSYWDGSKGNLQTFVATSGWQQVSLTFTGSGSAYGNVALLHDDNQSSTGVFQFWGAQLNAGAAPSAYLATSGSVATTTTTTTTTPTFGANLSINLTAPGGVVVDQPPTANNDDAAVHVGGATQATGNVLTNDTDPENDPLTVVTVNGQAASVGATIAGTYGSLVLNANGAYTYVLASNAAVQALAPGQIVTDVFHYTISDGHSHPITTTINNQNLITWSEAFDNPAWVKFGGAVPAVTANVAAGPLGGASTADQITLSQADSGIYFQSAASGQYTFSVWVRLVSGDGHFDLGYWDGSKSNLQGFVATTGWQQVSLTLTGSGSAYGNVAILHDDNQSATGVFQFWGAQLNPGATPTNYLATSGAAASATQTVTSEQVIGADLDVTVTGPPVSQAPIAMGDAAATAGLASLSGGVLGNDISPSGDALSVTAVDGLAADVGVPIAGTYGALVLGANGGYTYTPANNAAMQALAPGQTATDVFQYTVSDGHSYTQTTSSISGQNFILFSEAFDNSHWVKFAASGAAPTVTANVAAGPLGGAATAEQIVLGGANSGLYYSTAISGQYTFSVWVKSVSGSGSFDLSYWDGSAAHATTFAATSAWQRYSITFTGNNLASDNIAFLHDAAQTTSGTFQIFGAQLNPGALPGDYVATTGHYDSVFTTTTTPAVSTANLDITVAGPDPGSVTPGALTFAGGGQAVTVNLATQQWSHAMTVLPLGDSITYGWTQADYTQGQTNTDDGYRGPLWWDFANNASLINFVGPNTSGDSLLPDQAHAGYPGERSDQIASRLPAMLATYHPDAILLMAGTNDIFQETAPASHVADSIRSMLTAVAQESPGTHVYVATLMPINPAQDGEPGDNTMVATVNAAIKATVAAAAAQGDNVSLVDTSSMTVSDLFDAAHPTTAGYAKLANIWYNAILAQQPVSGGTPAGAAHAIAAGVNVVTGSSGDDLLIANNNGDTLNGGPGNDRLVAGGGADVLTGGTGADQFVFGAQSGHATITDYNQSQGDHILLDGFGLTQFSQISGDISSSGGTTTINLTSFGSHSAIITLQNFTGTLGANDFWFG
jgi:VCBS repeat-containing protein